MEVPRCKSSAERGLILVSKMVLAQVDKPDALIAGLDSIVFEQTKRACSEPGSVGYQAPNKLSTRPTAST